MTLRDDIMDFSTMAGLSRRMIHPENRSPLFRIMRLAKSRFLSRLSLLLSMTAAELRASSAVALMAALSQISFDQTFSATLKFYGSDRSATDHPAPRYFQQCRSAETIAVGVPDNDCVTH
jgi:hypothetical protein